MYEFEFINKANNEHFFYYGYSMNDLHRRYPEVNFDELLLVCHEYID